MRYVNFKSEEPLFDYDYMETLEVDDRHRLARKGAKYILEVGIPEFIPFRYTGIIMIGMVLGDEKGILLGEQTFIDDFMQDTFNNYVRKMNLEGMNEQEAIGNFIYESMEGIVRTLIFERNIFASDVLDYYYDYDNIMNLGYMATITRQE